MSSVHDIPVMPLSDERTLPAVGLGTWQRVIVVDPNRENDRRRLRLTFVPA